MEACVELFVWNCTTLPWVEPSSPACFSASGLRRPLALPKCLSAWG